jgi:asparagine synthase (glutamine-hydrolysing)
MHGLCGIAGKGNPAVLREKLSAMTASMSHEAFYDSQTYTNSNTGVYLAVIAHYRGPECPYYTEQDDGSVVMMASDHYWSDESRDARGVSTASIPRLLLDGLRAKDPSVVDAINGQFAGAAVQHSSGEVWIFNDRFGYRRLFVHMSDDMLFFATEAKGLLAVLPETRDFDADGVAEYVALGTTTGSRSLFRGVEVLDPATVLSYRASGTAKRTRYFTPEHWRNNLSNESASPEAYVDTFPGVVARYCSPPDDAGISLTGGLDSRMVEAALSKLAIRIPTYTFGSMYRDTYDVKVARRVARQCGQEHTVLRLGSHYLNGFLDTLERSQYISDGYGGLLGSAALYLNTKAREIAPIRLTGNYGSELLRGARAFAPTRPRPGFFVPQLSPALEAACGSYAEQTQLDPVTFAAFYQAPHQAYGLRAVEGSQVSIRTPFMDVDLLTMLYQMPEVDVEGPKISKSIIQRCEPRLFSIPSDLGYLGSSSGAAVACRVALRKLSFKLEYVFGRGMSPRMAKLRAAVPWLVPEKWFLGLHKFAHFGYWSRGSLCDPMVELARYARKHLSFVDAGKIEKRVEEHVSGTAVSLLSQ